MLLMCCLSNKNNNFVAYVIKRWVWFIMVCEKFFFQKCLKDICLHSLTSYDIRKDPTALSIASVATVILAFLGIFLKISKSKFLPKRLVVQAYKRCKRYYMAGEIYIGTLPKKIFFHLRKIFVAVALAQ